LKEERKHNNTELVGYDGYFNDEDDNLLSSTYEFIDSFRDSVESPFPGYRSQNAINALEMQNVLEGNAYVQLSMEQGVDCSADETYGCCGGDCYIVYDNNSKYVAEKDYPYVMQKWNETLPCRPSECKTKGKDVVVTIQGYDEFYGFTAAELKKQIWMYGPLTVSMESPEEFYDYSGGIFDCTNYFTTPYDGHTIVAVGFGKDYIMLRNSWGQRWGMEGDFLVTDKSFKASCHVVSNPYDSMTRVSVYVPSPSSRSTGSASMSSASMAIPFSFLITFLFCVYTIFICTYLLFDTVNIPFASLLPTWFYLGIDRGFRVLGATLVSLVAMIFSYPLFFLFMIEMFKLCGLLGKKNKDIENLIIDNGPKINKEIIINIDNNDNNNLELKNKENDIIVNDNIEQNEENDNDENNNKFPLINEKEDKDDEENENENQNLIVENKNNEN